MKERYGMIVLGAALIIAVILMFACSSPATVHTDACCEVEEPVLTRDYEEPQTGSFDFPMHGLSLIHI